MKAFVVILMGLFLSSMVHADAAPGPLQPSVTVYMQRNGSPATDISEITYHCYGENTTSTAPSEKRLAVLNCSGGSCENSGDWFNKLNPCFFFPDGFFSYESSGRRMESAGFSTQRKDMHYITIDADSGSILKQTQSNICFFSFVIPALLVPAFLHRML